MEATFVFSPGPNGTTLKICVYVYEITPIS